MGDLPGLNKRAFLKRLDTIFKQLVPPEPAAPIQLPYLVLDWPDAGARDGSAPPLSLPDDDEQYDHLLVSLSAREVPDLPGYEQHNREHWALAQRLGIPPKVYYGFDPRALVFQEDGGDA